MKKLLFTACLLLTFSSAFAAVGEDATTCAEMIQAGRNTNVEAAASEEAKVEAVEEAATVQ